MGETTWCPSPAILGKKRVNAFVLGTALMIKGIAAVYYEQLFLGNTEFYLRKYQSWSTN